ncbi:ferredoxin [Candidatus Woesearchaeota archaeon]|nr:ferredoxin [Candidatus Woesearchaeota archaeon]
MKYKIEHNRPDCIGCAACAAVAPDHWEMNEDGKSDIRGGKRLPTGWEEKEIDESSFNDNKEAAESCPVNVIHLIRLDTKEKII